MLRVVIFERQIDEGHVLGQRIELAGHATSGADDGPAAAGRIDAGHLHDMHGAAIDRRDAIGIDQVAVERGVDLDLVSRTGIEGDIAIDRQPADRVAGCNRAAGGDRRRADRADAGEPGAGIDPDGRMLIGTGSRRRSAR
jgi:hypothetical protein